MPEQGCKGSHASGDAHASYGADRVLADPCIYDGLKINIFHHRSIDMNVCFILIESHWMTLPCSLAGLCDVHVILGDSTVVPYVTEKLRCATVRYLRRLRLAEQFRGSESLPPPTLSIHFVASLRHSLSFAALDTSKSPGPLESPLS